MNIVQQQHVHLYENSSGHLNDDQDYPLYFGPYVWTHFEAPDLEYPNSRRVVFTAQGSVQLQSSTPDIQINPDVPYRFSGHDNNWFQSYLHIHLSLPYTQGLYEPRFSEEEPSPWSTRLRVASSPLTASTREAITTMVAGQSSTSGGPRTMGDFPASVDLLAWPPFIWTGMMSGLISAYGVTSFA